jgi:acetyl-CoA carboxylase biotin carboxyl carrier protein
MQQVGDGNRGGADVAFDREGLDRVIRAFDDGDWDEIHLSADGIELHLSVGAHAGHEPYPADSASRAAAGEVTAVAATEWTTRAAADPGTVGEGTVDEGTVDEGTVDEGTGDPGSADPVADPAAAVVPAADGQAGAVAVAAPCPGFFWRSPRPGAPPYAEVGDDVEAGATLCIIEVMKLMNHVTAQCAGTVTEVIARNGTQVERGQPLFWLVPREPDPC